MGLMWMWISIIYIYCMFCDVISSTGDISVGVNKSNSSQVETTNWTATTYISVCVPIALALLAVIIITVLLCICKRKRNQDLLQQEAIYYGNSETPHTVQHNGYKSTENGEASYGPKPPLTLQEEPIYINVQAGSSLKPHVERDRTENIYCNVGCDTYH